MVRRSQSIMAIVVLLTLLGFPLLAPLARHLTGSAAAQTNQPNIVIIQFDDMRASDWKALPRTQELLAAGTWFENYFATTPTCCPSRASLLTGLYAHNHRVLTTDGPRGGWQAFRPQERETLATWLNRAGYRTALVGKYLNGFTNTARRPPGWDRMYATTELAYYNFGLNENGRWVSYEKKKGRKQRYVTDVLKSRSIRFIRGTSDDTPIFLYVGMRAPHAPATPAKRHRRLHRGAKAKQSDAFNRIGTNKPRYIRDNRRFDARTIKQLNAFERRRLQSLAAADEMVEAIWDMLETENRLDNTYIFVLSDNGLMMGEFRVMDKGVPYDSSVRIPMIAWGPEFSGGADSRLIGNIDIAPTIIDIVGLPIDPATRDGVSLLNNRSRSAILLESFNTNGGYAAIRTVENYLYVEYRNEERELYDYATDPDELENLAGTDLDVEDDLADRLEALRGCVGTECFRE